MSRRLDRLCPSLRVRVNKVIAQCAESRCWLLVLDTDRTMAEQKTNIENGVSWTLRSFHLPSTNVGCPICGGGLSHAIDMAPLLTLVDDVVKAINWDKTAEDWEVYSSEVKAAGLEWGGDWTHEDYSHAQLPRSTWT